MSLLLKGRNRGMRVAADFVDKNSFACVLVSALNYIFHWKAHLLIFSKSEFNSSTDTCISRTFEKREVP